MIGPILKKKFTAIIATLFLILSLGSLQAQSKQLAIGQQVPDIKIDKILDEASATMHSFKGKITIIDFWATWCGPCIMSMPHLADLQKKYPDNLNIISVSDEPEITVRKFLKKNPLTFKTALDTSKTLEEYFPRLSIPHTILLDKNMKVLAITYPQMVTTKVIDEVLKGGFVDLKEKKFEIWDQDKNYLQADSTTLSKFEIRSQISSLPFGIQTWQNYSALYGRRQTFINHSFDILIMRTYQENLKFVVYDTAMDIEPFEKVYCVDVVVDKNANQKLELFMRESIHRHFGIASKIDSIEQPVMILKVIDKKRFSQSKKRSNIFAPPADDSLRTFKADNIKISELIYEYVQRYSVYPIVDNTDLRGGYDFNFSFSRNEDPRLIIDGPLFHESLRKQGLALVLSKARVPALFVYKEKL